MLNLACFSALEAQWTGFHRVIDKEQRFFDPFEVIIDPMAEDSLGNLWIATKKGLCKYNGSEMFFHQHDPSDSTSLSDNNIESMHHDKQGNIWIACNGKGIDVFDLQGHKKLHLEHEIGNDQSIQSDRVWGIFQDDLNKIWISYFAGGISSYSLKDGTFEHFDLDSIVSDTTFRARTVTHVEKHDTEEHTFWLSSYFGLIKWNTDTKTGKSFQFYSEYNHEKIATEHNEEKLNSNHLRIMEKDSDGILWLGTFGGLVRFDPKTESYQVFYDQEGYKHTLNNILGILDYSPAELLITLHQGLAFFNKHSYKVQLVSDRFPNGGQSNLFGRLFKSSNGCIYLGSNSSRRGLYKMCEQHGFIRKTHLPRNTNEVIATENYVHYYGGNKLGIVSRRISDGKEINYPYKDIDIAGIRAIHSLGGDSLLVANILDAFLYHPEFGIRTMPELRQIGLFRFESIIKDSEGVIWTGRQKEGIFRYDPETKIGQQINRQNGELPGNEYVTDIFEDSEKDIWISTSVGWSFHKRNENVFHPNPSKELAKKYNIKLNGITTIREAPDGKIWIVGETDGVLVWNKKADSLETFLKYGVDFDFHGTWDAEIDHQGDMWLVSSEKEIVVIDHNTHKAKNFSTSFGINSSLYSINLAPSGKMYVGSSSGYYEFYPEELKFIELRKPIPHVNGFSIFDQKKDSVISDEAILLEHDENFFTFRFTSQNYESSEFEKFQVRMLPFDKEWVSMGKKRERGYTGVPAGQYEFQVRSKTQNINWQYSPTIQLRIKQVWYKSWLFRIILALLLLSALSYYIYWRRKLIIKELETEKLLSDLNAKALRTQMNPHFLFNSLNSIRYQILSEDKQKAADYLTKFSRLVRIILQNSEKDFVTISSELNLMSLYIDMEQIRFIDSFEYELTIDPKLEKDSVLIPPMIIQPFIENSIIHGINPLEGKGIIKLRMFIKDELLHIELEDNGIGRAASKKMKADRSTKQSMGMKITKSRIDLLMESADINQRLIEDVLVNGEVKGTLVHFVLPLLYSGENKEKH
ncbi:histidine kinase [Saprospiraceae bacterium]|nr:histidine kinase [Saprospiraceae bacterium]